MLHGHAGAHLAIHRQLVSLTLHYAAGLQLSQETAHTAVALMDRCVVAGITATDHLQTLLVCACLRLAAMQESAFLPSPLAIQALTNIPGASSLSLSWCCTAGLPILPVGCAVSVGSDAS